MDSVRTCLGCRLRTPPSALLRVVERNRVVIPDPSATMTGRGAWVHPTTECVEASIKRKALGRALRSDGALDASLLWSHVEGEHPISNN
ncbi:MAG: YlxR family protein [Microbacteriaceae bacterium]